MSKCQNSLNVKNNLFVSNKTQINYFSNGKRIYKIGPAVFDLF